jgi:Flp pilus assembly protein TadB
MLVDSGGMRYAFKLAAAGIGILLIGVLGIVIFDRIWFRVGLGAAIVVVCGGLLLFAWMTDRKDRARRGELDELPRV